MRLIELSAVLPDPWRAARGHQTGQREYDKYEPAAGLDDLDDPYG